MGSEWDACNWCSEEAAVVKTRSRHDHEREGLGEDRITGGEEV